MSIITDDFEDRCRRIVHKMKKHPSEPTPATFIGREMALTLDHIDVVRKRQKVFDEWFVEKELYLDTQIMNTEKRIDLMPDWLQRTRLKNEFTRSLDTIRLQALRHSAEVESTLQQLQSRLMELWNMYDQLSFKHGDTKNTA